MSYDSISKIEELLEFKSVSRILKNWEPVELLGSGGFSYVFRMRNCLTGEEAALKFAPEPYNRDHCSVDFTSSSRENINLLIHETEEVKKFRGQQNIIQYKEEPEKLEISINANGTCVKRYAVLSLMPVHTPIFNNEKKFITVFQNYGLRLQLAMDIATALTELNRQHTRHRDIKPQNILMDSDKDKINFLLSDFGEARQGDSTMRFGQTGSKYYKAPEVVHPTQFGQNRDRADIYSFGIVLYQLFNNGVDSEKSYPFFDKNGNLSPSAHQFARRHKLSSSDSEIAYLARYEGLPLEKPCEADSELSEIILKACAFDPNDRYKNAQELLDALIKYTAKYEGGTVRSGDLSTPPPPPPPTSSKRGCMVGVILFAALSAFAIPKILPEVIQTIFSNPIPAPTTSSIPSPTQVPSPTSTPTPTPTPVPTATPSPTPTATPSPTPTATPSPTPTATPSPMLIPANVLLEVGDVYTFGRYEQDSKKKDGAEDIEWIALAKSDKGVLLISRYILDCIPYNETRTAVTWQMCTLREWMNGVFYTEAFTHEERQGILQVTLDNEDNPAYHTRGGDSTLDRVFALSASEAEMYLTNANRNTQATVYAAAQGAKLRTENQNKWVYWWLRTPGDKPERAMVTTLRDNSLDYQGNGVGRKFDGGGNNNTGVRPCIWLSWDYLAKDNSELRLTLEGTATGYSGNDITVALTVEKDVIINCTIYDEWATDKMKKGYELTANAIIGKTCEYLQNHSDAEILEEVRAYADGIGQKLTGGKQDEFSAKASIKAVKDALSKINN